MGSFIDWAMTLLMSTLVSWFGFREAVKIKDSFDFFAGGAFVGLLVVWLWGNAYSRIVIDQDVEVGVAIIRVKDPDTGKVHYEANPHTLAQHVEVSVAYYLAHLTPSKRIYYSRIKSVTKVLYIIAILIFLVGMLTANWVTPEWFEEKYHNGHPPPLMALS